jgi:hypothetical protein
MLSGTGTARPDPEPPSGDGSAESEAFGETKLAILLRPHFTVSEKWARGAHFL